MKIFRILLLAIVVICLFSIFSGPLMRPVYDHWLPSLAARWQPDGASPLDPQRRVSDDALVHMKILNGIGVDNLAGDVSLLLDTVGCVGRGIGNAVHDHYPRSLLINRRLSAERAATLARDLGDLPLLLEIDTAADEDVVLVLGADYQRVLATLKGARGDIGR